MDLDYQNSLLRPKPTLNQEQLKELERVSLNFHFYIKIKAAFQ